MFIWYFYFYNLVCFCYCQFFGLFWYYVYISLICFNVNFVIYIYGYIDFLDFKIIYITIFTITITLIVPHLKCFIWIKGFFFFFRLWFLHCLWNLQWNFPNNRHCSADMRTSWGMFWTILKTFPPSSSQWHSSGHPVLPRRGHQLLQPLPKLQSWREHLTRYCFAFSSGNPTFHHPEHYNC